MVKNKAKIFLLPLAWLYGAVIGIRNQLFDRGLVSIYESPLKSIGIGNLSTGGSGKTPMAIYILSLLEKNGIKSALLSRGYGRKTKGILSGKHPISAENFGDEPALVAEKFHTIDVVVSEKRKTGFQWLEKTDNEVAVLDDCFQHRKVKTSVTILLTTYQDPFYKDMMLPTGNLREQKAGAKRADIVVVTKCKPDLTIEQANEAASSIRKWTESPVYFSTVNCEPNVHSVFGDKVLHLNSSQKIPVLSFSAIANNLSFFSMISPFTDILGQMQFADHHQLTTLELNSLVVKYNKLKAIHPKLIVLTTEKDASRLKAHPLIERLHQLPLYSMGIEMAILFNQAHDFEQYILENVRSNPSSKGVY